jgi:type I restriction enzyme R subunit
LSHQSEAVLESNLVKQLTGLGYAPVQIKDEESLLANLKSQLEVFNNTIFLQKEFNKVFNNLAKGNVFEKAKTLRDRFQLTRDNGESFYVQFFNNEDWNKNLFQVTNQVAQDLGLI